MNKEKKNLLVFGHGLSFIFAFVGARLWIKHGFSMEELVWFILATAFLIVTTINYQWLRVIYKKWMQVAICIGTIISAIVLTVLFYTVFGLVGIILRLMKKDILDENIAQGKITYWLERSQEHRGKEYYHRQF